MASGRLSSLLALEIELAGRAPANRNRITGADQANEHGEPALGCATHSRRTAQAWFSVAQSTSPSTWSSNADLQVRDGGPFCETTGRLRRQRQGNRQSMGQALVETGRILQRRRGARGPEGWPLVHCQCRAERTSSTEWNVMS